MIRSKRINKYALAFTPIIHFVVLSAILLYSAQNFALDKIGRMGIGFSQELQNDLPALSFKIQKNRSFAFGALANFSSSSNGGYGAGIKLYRNLFDEPQLHFYSSAMLGLLGKKISGTTYSGFQFDLTLGTEFHLQGLNSVGFSLEFGVQAYKTSQFVFQTLGHSFVVAGVHFYL